jgi:hypothetical protein
MDLPPWRVLVTSRVGPLTPPHAVVTDYSLSLTPERIELLFYKGLKEAAVGLMIVDTLIGRVGRD